MQALKPFGIKTILYLPGNPPAHNSQIRDAMGWPGKNEYAPSQYTIRIWNAVIEEWSLRYGTDLAAWWIDGMWFPAAYSMNLPENWHSRSAALKAGNPNCAIALNGGLNGGFSKGIYASCPYIDMTDGESKVLGPTPKNGRWADPVNRLQWFIYTFIGAIDPVYAGWGNKGVCRTAKDLDAWLAKVFSKGGTVTLDAKVNRFGHIDPEQLKLLKDTPACQGIYPASDPDLLKQ
jgi:hypothetical protein